MTHLVGMNLSQFCQVAMLPQGRFQAFLRARSEERHRLLQQLFRTSRFEDVERWLRDHRRELRQQSGASPRGGGRPGQPGQRDRRRSAPRRLGPPRPHRGGRHRRDRALVGAAARTRRRPRGRDRRRRTPCAPTPSPGRGPPSTRRRRLVELQATHASALDAQRPARAPRAANRQSAAAGCRRPGGRPPSQPLHELAVRQQRGRARTRASAAPTVPPRSPACSGSTPDSLDARAIGEAGQDAVDAAARTRALQPREDALAALRDGGPDDRGAGRRARDPGVRSRRPAPRPARRAAAGSPPPTPRRRTPGSPLPGRPGPASRRCAGARQAADAGRRADRRARPAPASCTPPRSTSCTLARRSGCTSSRSGSTGWRPSWPVRSRSATTARCAARPTILASPAPAPARRTRSPRRRRASWSTTPRPPGWPTTSRSATWSPRLAVAQEQAAGDGDPRRSCRPPRPRSRGCPTRGRRPRRRRRRGSRRSRPTLARLHQAREAVAPRADLGPRQRSTARRAEAAGDRPRAGGRRSTGPACVARRRWPTATTALAAACEEALAAWRAELDRRRPRPRPTPGGARRRRRRGRLRRPAVARWPPRWRPTSVAELEHAGSATTSRPWPPPRRCWPTRPARGRRRARRPTCRPSRRTIARRDGGARRGPRRRRPRPGARPAAGRPGRRAARPRSRPGPRCAASLELATRLAALTDGTSPDNRLQMRLSGYVLAWRLAQVVAAANERLARMSDQRYSLEHTGRRVPARPGAGSACWSATTGPARPATRPPCPAARRSWSRWPSPSGWPT